MEEKEEMNDKSDCRRYYQLVQEKVLPESMDSKLQPIRFISNQQQNGDVEDLNLSFQNTTETEIPSILPRKVKLKYFERDTEDEEDIDDIDTQSHEIQNADGHYIMEDDAWSDYWDSGVDDIDHVFSKSRLVPIDKENETKLQNTRLQLLEIERYSEEKPKNCPKKCDFTELLEGRPLNLAEELSQAIQEDLNLNPIPSDTDSTTFFKQNHTVGKDLTKANQMLSQNEDNEYISSDSNSKHQYSGGSNSSISTFTESVSPPPLCPIPNPYELSAKEHDHPVRHCNLSSSESDLTRNKVDGDASPRPWLNHIPKHYSLDYDFSDDWDLVIAGTTAATVLKDTESLDVVVRHQPEKQILGGGPGSEIARRSRGKKFVIQHITGGNGNADGLLDNSVCGAASQCCIIQ